MQFAVADRFLESIPSLQELQFNGSNSIGISVASSLITLTRNSRVAPRDEKDLCLKLIASFHSAFGLITKILSQDTYSLLLTHNGRFACSKGAAMAAYQSGLPVCFYDQGSSIDKF